MKPMVRHAGKWHIVEPPSHEPPRVTWNVAWKQLKGMTVQDSYRQYYAQQREISKVLYLNKKDGQ
jgi:hypothetical protein